MFTDIHSHILYDVDDGAKDITMSIHMIEAAIKENIHHIVLTPHVQSRVTKVSRDVHIEHFNVLNERVKALNLPVTLHLGAEVTYRSHLKPNYKEYTLGSSNYVLVEFSMREPQEIEDVIFDISRMGLIPIVAHVERYPYLSIDDIIAIKRYGLLQANTSSILGFDNLVKPKYVLRLLKLGLIDIIASDAHNLDKRIPNLKTCYDFLSKHLEKDVLDKIFIDNVKPIIETMSR